MESWGLKILGAAARNFTIPSESRSDRSPWLQALQVLRGVHPLMKDANDRDTVIRDAKVNHVPLDITAAVPLTNRRFKSRGRFVEPLNVELR
jgi:hypothetical protein